MKGIDKLKVNRYLKKLEYLETECTYHRDLYGQINALFMQDVEEKVIIMDQEMQDKYGGLLDKETTEESKKDFEERQKTKEKIPNSLKKTYKKLLGKTHPDRFINATEGEREEMEEIYKEVVECAETGDWLGIIKNAQRLNIPIEELDDHVLLQIQKQISNVELQIKNYQKTYQWKWYHTDSKDLREDMVDRYIKSTLDKK